MKKEYDFSKAEQGKFYCKPENMKILADKKGSAPEMRHHMPTEQSHNSAKFWIKHLHLIHHPEGGWFAETYRATETTPADALPARFDGARSFCTFS